MTKAAELDGSPVAKAKEVSQAGAPANDTGGAPGASVIDQDDLAINELARAVLAREIRPRIGSVRRLAEAVLEAEKATAKASKPAKSAKQPKARKGKGRKKKKKLARIPGQTKK